jgi:hypothetical protein
MNDLYMDFLSYSIQYYNTEAFLDQHHAIIEEHNVALDEIFKGKIMKEYQRDPF